MFIGIINKFFYLQLDTELYGVKASAASLYEPGRRFHPVKFRIKLQIKKLIDDAYEQKNERLLRAFDKEMMAGINEYP